MLDIMKPLARLNYTPILQIVMRHYFRDAGTLKRTSNSLRNINKFFHNTVNLTKSVEDEQKSVSIFDAAGQRKKQKSTFLDVIHTYVNEEQRKTGHVAFVYAALAYMDEFGVNEDLEVYKEILNTLPKGRYVASTLLQAEFMHYPREQQCIIDVLEKMENNGVIPDPETEQIILNISGQHAFPLRKLRRMAYWQTKFKNLNPWPAPRPLDTNPLELAKLAIRKISSVDVQSTMTIFDTNDVMSSIDKTWIVSASSPDQERLISEHPVDVAIYVEGPYKIWISKASVDYFILYADVLKPRYKDNTDIDDVSNLDISLWKKAKKQLALYRSIHEQDHQTIFGVCATGTSSKDSLLSWIRCLQPKNPALVSIPVLFKFTRSVDEFKRIGSGELEKNNLDTQLNAETLKKINS